MTSIPSRRNFLFTTGRLALAATLPLSCRSKNYKKCPVVRRRDVIGHNDHTYEAEPGWGNIDPVRYPVQHCQEMVMDSRGRLLCTTVSRQQDVLVYNKDGKLLDNWKHNFTEAHGLSLSGTGEYQTVWITDSASGKVVNFDLEGRALRDLPPPTELLTQDQSYHPTETAVAPNGDIYVADGYGTNKVFRYDDKGRLLQSFGGSDFIDCCHGVAVDTRGDQPTLLVTSRNKQELQRWSLDGKLLLRRRLPGLYICRPVLDGDNIYLSVINTRNWSEYDGILAVLDRNLNVVSLPGATPPSNQEDFRDIVSNDRTFMNPHDVCLDEDKNLYVPQWYSGRTYPLRLRRV